MKSKRKAQKPLATVHKRQEGLQPKGKRGRPRKEGGPMVLVPVRLPQDMVAFLDQEAARLMASSPGLVVSRGDALRVILARALALARPQRRAIVVAPATGGGGGQSAASASKSDEGNARVAPGKGS